MSRQQRTLSLFEFAIGSLVVVGHNVFHVLPNEVPILVMLAIASIRLREGSWSAIGLSRPKSWMLTILFAVITAVIVIAMGQFVTEPLSKAMGLQSWKSDATSLGLDKHNIWSLAKTFVVIWTFAAFGEEISYRRYLLGRAADLGNRSAIAYWIALFFVSALFGIGHFYQGPAGMFQTACDGFVIAAAYLVSKRNLWVAVFAHGLIDSIGLAAIFFGLAN